MIGLVGEQTFHDEAHEVQALAACAAAVDAALDAKTNLASSAIARLFGRQSRAPTRLAAFFALLEVRATADAESPIRATALFDAAQELAIATHAAVQSTGYLD